MKQPLAYTRSLQFYSDDGYAKPLRAAAQWVARNEDKHEVIVLGLALETVDGTQVVTLTVESLALFREQKVGIA